MTISTKPLGTLRVASARCPQVSLDFNASSLKPRRAAQRRARINQIVVEPRAAQETVKTMSMIAATGMASVQ